MTYNRKTPGGLESDKQSMRSPSFDSSSPYGRTPSRREWTSPITTRPLHYRSDAQCSPILQQYMRPPPITGRTGGASNVDRDTTAQVSNPAPNLNTAIPSSPSPLAEARYPCVSGNYRPSSASGSRPWKDHVPFMACPAPQRAASTVTVPPQPRPTYYDGCGIIVEERDPVTRDVISRYRCGALLGTGGFAQVFEFKDLVTGSQYAGKVIDKRTLTRRGSEAKFRMEVDIHNRMKHPNIIQFIKTFQDEYYHYILLEQCSRKNLMEFSKERGTFTCEEVQHIMIQIISAVEYMHNHLVIHRDLKLGNIMIDFGGNMKIGDFGFASELASSSDKKTTTCGTPNYIAPEVLANEKTCSGYGLEADIWSLGVVLYALVFGTPPFETKDIATTYSKIRRVDYQFPTGKPVSDSCKDLIQWMLQKEPQWRPSPAQILRHAFFCFPHPPCTVPKRLIPPEGPPSTFPNERRRSPLWTSPVAMHSPFAYYEERSSGCPRSASQRPEYGKGTDHETRKILHESFNEKDCMEEAGLAAPYLHSGDKRTRQRPSPPSVMLQSSIHCSKYGYGFLLYHNGKQYPTVFLNDKTKLVYDVSSDVVFYYGRSRMQAASPLKSGNRSPLLSEELATRGFRDELVVYRNASTTLAQRREGDHPTSRTDAAASKKLAITKFFLPFLERGTRDKRMVAMTCAVKEWRSVWEADLFAPFGPDDGKGDTIYVKDAVMESLYELTGEYQDVDMQLLVARMSDYSFQVSMRCNKTPQSLYIPRYGDLDASKLDVPWGLDILVYTGFRALMVLETRESRVALSFWNIRSDTKMGNDGRVYFAAGATAKEKSIMLPSATLRIVTALLQKVRCCADILDCFS